MRKHHNKLFYGKFTHKTVFKMDWANALYPTTDEHLLRFVKGQGYFYGKQHPMAADLAGFIMENRHTVKFRIQGKKTIFYSNFEYALELLTKYWDNLYDIQSINVEYTNILNKNEVYCKRYPHKVFEYQVYLKKDLHHILNENEKQSFVQFCENNREGIKISSAHVANYILGETKYCWNGYFYVKDEKYLSALYLIIQKGIDKVQKYIKM